MKSTTGEIANRSHKVGISFTLIQNMVKIPRIKSNDPFKL